MSAESLQGCRVDVVVCGSEALLTVVGEVDVASREVFAGALASIASAELNLTLDLAAVPFMDVASVRLLLETADALDRQGRSLRGVTRQPFLRRVFAVLNAGHLLVA
jgi:anti-anti-sigma factor